MRNMRVARRYAMALMAMAPDDDAVERIGADLTAVGNALRASRDLRLLMTSPVVPVAKKKAILTELFARRVGRETMDLLQLLVTKHRGHAVADIIGQFHALVDERMGIVNADVVTAVQCAGPQERALRDRLERYTGKKVRMRMATDERIRGGVRVRIGDTVLDASLAHQLDRLRDRFLQGSISATESQRTS
jgi:F-type H+-transporting ATPase subunit delta